MLLFYSFHFISIINKHTILFSFVIKLIIIYKVDFIIIIFELSRLIICQNLLSLIKWVRKTSHLNQNLTNKLAVNIKMPNKLKILNSKNLTIILSLKKIIRLKINPKLNDQTTNQTKPNKSKRNNKHQNLLLMKIKTLKKPKQLINNHKSKVSHGLIFNIN